MKIPVSEIVFASLISLVMISTETGGIVRMLGASMKSDGRFNGTWTSYSPTKFGAMSAEFLGNGTCRFRGGADYAFTCKWREAENGQAKIETMTASGRSDVLSATVTGDYLIVLDPARETPFVRTDSKAAHERQRLVTGPSNFTLPW